jgi:hypothetical protein
MWAPEQELAILKLSIIPDSVFPTCGGQCHIAESNGTGSEFLHTLTLQAKAG